MTTTTEPETDGAAPAPPPSARPISLATIGRFLIGRRDAIIDIAHSRSALWLGLLFVLSAGFAREYDGEDLLREPWHLLLPLVASVGSSFLLYLLVYAAGWARGVRDAPFWSTYRQFLTLYWMTAPLAWLYAIPFERFSSAASAVSANLFLLGLVATWRVALITRVVSVLYRCHWVAALFVVMLFADAVAVAAMSLTPRPVVQIMGGIRHTESEQVIVSVTCFVLVWGILLLPVWLIGVVAVMSRGKSPMRRWQLAVEDSRPQHPVARVAWLLAAFSVVCWIPVLPATQVEQQNRWRVTDDLRSGRIDEAVRYMSERRQDEFPPHWDPPPRIGYGESTPPFHEVLDAVIRTNAAPWVRRVYLDKHMLQSAGTHFVPFSRGLRLDDMNDEQLRRYTEMLLELPDGAAIAASHARELQEPDLYTNETRELTEERRARLAEIERLARSYDKQHQLGLFPEDEHEEKGEEADEEATSGNGTDGDPGSDTAS